MQNSLDVLDVNMEISVGTGHSCSFGQQIITCDWITPIVRPFHHLPICFQAQFKVPVHAFKVLHNL